MNFPTRLHLTVILNPGGPRPDRLILKLFWKTSLDMHAIVSTAVFNVTFPPNRIFFDVQTLVVNVVVGGAVETAFRLNSSHQLIRLNSAIFQTSIPNNEKSIFDNVSIHVHTSLESPRNTTDRETIFENVVGKIGKRGAGISVQGLRLFMSTRVFVALLHVGFGTNVQ